MPGRAASGAECQSLSWREARQPPETAPCGAREPCTPLYLEHSAKVDLSDPSPLRAEERSGLHGERSDPPAELREHTARRPLPSNPLEHMKRGPVSVCERTWVTLLCGCGAKSVPAGGCYREDCVICTSDVGRRRARKAWAKFEFSFRGRPLLYTVFTVPPNRRCLATKKQWQLWRKRLVKLLKAEYGFEFGLESSHACSTKDTTFFHPQFNFLWLQVPGSRSYIDVNKLRRQWGKIVGADDPDKVVFHTQYVYMPHKQRHKINYSVRAVPGWFHWSGTRVRWYYLKGKNVAAPPRPSRICEECGQPIRFVALVDPELACVLRERARVVALALHGPEP